MHALATIHRINGPEVDNDAIIQHALRIIERRARKPEHFIGKPDDARAYVRLRLAEDAEREHFLVTFLNQRHGVIAGEVLFHGTIDGASVHPRIVLQRALALNASAVILAHNHPSGNPEPSQADDQLTRRLIDTLSGIDVRVLDHLVVGEPDGIYSYAENGRI